MWKRHGSNFSKDSEAYDIARGLYDSKGTQQMGKYYPERLKSKKI